jgi:hypothetical protein
MAAEFRVICSLSPIWNRCVSNRFNKAAAEKFKASFDGWCPGEHTIKPIAG